ncbi:MAG: type II secretion system protein GspK [Armatimonadota bacterium]|nr:type II secretion system protein GspK [Armatimonadota bacterium]MCX7776883.1 type II secretion system protein GspK [Armatimonadota bacterium]MDW8024431.1 type II secretion system protein GspK [Armatimonadota bacterium]
MSLNGTFVSAHLADRDRAIALIFVLWLIAVLALLSASLLLTVRMEVRSSALQEDEIKAYYLARAGIAHALRLLSTDEMSFDSYSEQWALIDSEKEGALNDVGRYIVRVEDEAGKLNLNIATRDELVRFFGDEALADAIIDWRDEDDIPAAYGAEADWYLSSGLPYKPRNAPFETLHELLLVRGMTIDWFYNSTQYSAYRVYDVEGQSALPLHDCLTTYSAVPNVMPDGSPLVNLNEASAEEMKRVLGDILTDEEIEAILRYREGAPSQQGTQRPTGQRPSSERPANQPSAPTQGGERPQSLAPPAGVPSGAGFGQDTTPQMGIQIPPNRAAIQRPPSSVPGDGQSVEGAPPQDINQDTSQQAAQAGEIRRAVSSNRFGSLADLFSVPGLPTDKARQIIDRVTIWGGRARYNAININTAPLEVLLSLPWMTQEIANDIVSFRQHRGAFESLSQLLDLSSIDERSFRQIIDRVSVRTQVFRIISVGWMDSGARYVIECVIERILTQPLTGESVQGVESRTASPSGQPSNASQSNVTFVVRYWRER